MKMCNCNLIFILIYRGFIPYVSKRTPTDQCPFRNGQNILETDIRFRNGHPFRNGQRNGGQMTMANINRILKRIFNKFVQ